MVWFIKNLSLQENLQHLLAEKEIQFCKFVFKFIEGRVSHDASNYINLPEYIYKVGSWEGLCTYIYEVVKGIQSDNEWLKHRKTVTSSNISLKSITK